MKMKGRAACLQQYSSSTLKAHFLMYRLSVPKIKPHLRCKSVCAQIFYIYIYTHVYIYTAVL